MIGKEVINCALRINLEFGTLDYSDVGGNFFSPEGVVKTATISGLIALQRI